MATPETGNLIWADPTELMRDNPAALIVNKESYDRMDAFFDPGLMQLQIGTRVATFSASGEQVIKIFITDGMTRTKFADDQKKLGHLTYEDYARAKGINLEELPEWYRNFRFDRLPVIDATTSYLRNPSVVLRSERREGQEALTIVQYLRAVIPPTVEHTQIAPGRIAALLVNSWENLVGPETAERFSALAALSFLVGTKAPTATANLLRQHLAKQKALIVDETPEERKKIEKHLLEMREVIHESKIDYGKIKIAEAAYVLVSTGLEVIGGEKEAEKQIYGLLHSPQLGWKLEEYPMGERDNKRRALGKLIAATLKGVPGHPEVQQVTIQVDEILRDQRLDYAVTERILASGDMAGEYIKVQQEINTEKLKTYYLWVTQKEELTPTEATFVARLGGKTYLQDKELATLGAIIQGADAAIQHIDMQVSRLENQRGQLQDKGVRAVTLDNIVHKFGAIRDSLFGIDSKQDLSKKNREMKETIAISQETIDDEIRLHTVSNIVSDVFGEARWDVTYYIFREKLVQETRVRHAAEQLRSLDLDLQARVVSGASDLEIDKALQVQEKRRATLLKPLVPLAQTTRAVESPGETDIKPSPVTESVRQIVEIDPSLLDRKSAVEGRIKKNSERLEQGVTGLLGILEDISLRRDEIPEDLLQKCDLMLNAFGELRFGRSNLVQIVEGYPGLLEQLRVLRQAKHHQEQVDLTKDAQTQI